MKYNRVLLVITILVSITLILMNTGSKTVAYAAGLAQQPQVETTRFTLGKLPVPCIVELSEVYLVIDGKRRHIVDWNTFLNAGYVQSDIVPCGSAANLLEDSPFTRLVKGSGSRVYLLENGRRRYIPNMATFLAMGFAVDNITVLPDAILALWPLGKALPVKRLPDTAVQNTSCVSIYARQISVAFANNTDHKLWINGLDGNCKEYHLWSVNGHTTTTLLTVPDHLIYIRIRDYETNQQLSSWTLSERANGMTFPVGS